MGARDRAVQPHGAQLPVDDRIPVRADAVVHEVAASDETVLFTKQRGELLLLNELGAGVFYLIDGRRTVSEITAELLAHFPDAPDPYGDVVRFLTHLAEVGALRFA